MARGAAKTGGRKANPTCLLLLVSVHLYALTVRLLGVRRRAAARHGRAEHQRLPCTLRSRGALAAERAATRTVSAALDIPSSSANDMICRLFRVLPLTLEQGFAGGILLLKDGLRFPSLRVLVPSTAACMCAPRLLAYDWPTLILYFCSGCFLPPAILSDAFLLMWNAVTYCLFSSLCLPRCGWVWAVCPACRVDCCRVTVVFLLTPAVAATVGIPVLACAGGRCCACARNLW